jgi:putative phosphoesterase
MIFAILSDTHDDLTSTARALEIARARGVEQVIHCGDLARAPTLRLFIGLKVSYIHGNMDRDVAEIERTLTALGNGSAAGADFHGVLDGVRVAAVHGHRAGALDELVRFGNYDYVFCGHTHRRRNQMYGTTQVVNPGAVGGVRLESSSFCLFDTAGRDLEFIELD